MKFIKIFLAISCFQLRKGSSQQLKYFVVKINAQTENPKIKLARLKVGYLCKYRIN